MLIGIDPVLSGKLLKILDEMGHGDELALVDRNFPAAATGRPVVRLGEITVDRAARAILSVFPLDTFVEQPLARMEVDQDPEIVTIAQEAVLDAARAGFEGSLGFAVIPREHFYARAGRCFATVHTLDDRPYGCFIFTKGVVFAAP
jgi:L-fucose mutarotase